MSKGDLLLGTNLFLFEELLTCPGVNLAQKLLVGNGLLDTVRTLLVLSKDSPDLVVEPLTAMSNEKNLQRLFNGNSACELERVVH